MPPERPLTQPDQNAIMGSAFRFRSGGYGQDAQGLVPAKGPGRRFAAVQPESGQDQDIGRCAFWTYFGRHRKMPVRWAADRDIGQDESKTGSLRPAEGLGQAGMISLW